jgi:hypothetical protein
VYWHKIEIKVKIKILKFIKIKTVQMSAVRYDDSYVHFRWFVICSVTVSWVFLHGSVREGVWVLLDFFKVIFISSGGFCRYTYVVYECRKLYFVMHNRDVKCLLYIFLGVLLIYICNVMGRIIINVSVVVFLNKGFLWWYILTPRFRGVV